jgi:transposase
MERASGSARDQHRHQGGEYRRIELITGAARRRRWSAAEKAAMVAESLQPGVNVSELARLRGIKRGLLLTWRRAALRGAGAVDGAFVPIRIEETPGLPAGLPDDGRPASARTDAAAAPGVGTIEIERGGLRIRFSGPVDADALGLVLAHVGRRA